MSLDDTLARPQSTAPVLSDPPTAWVAIGTCADMAHMNNYPVAMQRGGVTYVISGGDGGDTVLTSNDDGVTWNAPQTGDWPARRALSAALHDGKFYIVGGFSPGQGFGDTLVSDDCLHFTQLGDMPAPWGVRWAHTLLSAGDKLLMIAGVSGPDYSTEVWSMDAAGAWTKIAEGQFTKRAWAAGAALGSKLMVIGGWNDTDGAFAETLVSDDGGVTWTAHPFPAGMTARHSASAVTIGDTVYLVGGCTGRPGTTFYPDVWATKDGITWSCIDRTFRPIGRTFAAAPLGGRIGVMGTSANIIGLTPPPAWTELAPSPATMGLHSPATGYLNGKFYAWGGQFSNEVRVSDDGRSWSPLTNDLPALTDMAGTVHNGQLIACGGSDASGAHNEVYTSTDGVSWTQVAGAQRFTARSGHAVASFQGKLWVLGGGSYYDVWRSDDDGVGWTQANPSALARPITTCRAAVFRDQLWAFDASFQTYYRSSDGVDFGQPLGLPMSRRSGYGLAVVDGGLYLLRGRGAQPEQDVWVHDGQSWRRISATAPYPSMTQFGTVVSGELIIVFGGIVNSLDSERVLQFLPPPL